MNRVLHSFAYALDYLGLLVADVPEQVMASQPTGIANHPAWVIGHLTHTCELIGGAIGLPGWLPGGWAARFGAGSIPVADPALYGSKAAALATLRDAEARLAGAIRPLDAARLDEPFPEPAYLDVFPTIRHALTQVLVGHTAYHVGQVAVWRRAMGLPSAPRPFE